MTDAEIQELLKSTHTRLLLKYLAKSRACGGSYSPWEYGRGFTTEELKAELATREHVPNKREARKIRQDKAKGKKHARSK